MNDRSVGDEFPSNQRLTPHITPHIAAARAESRRGISPRSLGRANLRRTARRPRSRTTRRWASTTPDRKIDDTLTAQSRQRDAGHQVERHRCGRGWHGSAHGQRRPRPATSTPMPTPSATTISKSRTSRASPSTPTRTAPTSRCPATCRWQQSTRSRSTAADRTIRSRLRCAGLEARALCRHRQYLRRAHGGEPDGQVPRRPQGRGRPDRRVAGACAITSSASSASSRSWRMNIPHLVDTAGTRGARRLAARRGSGGAALRRASQPDRHLQCRRRHARHHRGAREGRPRARHRLHRP